MSILSPQKIYLAQTDTTVGFLSQNPVKLAKVKMRPANKPFLISVDTLHRLKTFARVPKKYRKDVRRAKRTTFLYPNKKAVRVVHDRWHLRFLKRFGWCYSTSANRSGKRFDKEWALRQADVVVEDPRGFFEGKPSTIIRLGRSKRKIFR